MSASSVRDFYDQLADDYHLIFPDWDASMAYQAAALERLLLDGLDARSHRILDCACGIGTQAIGLARAGHDVVGSDLSALAAARAATEAESRGTKLAVTAADMRALPFRAQAFEAVVCADNSLPHLLTAQDVRAALVGMRRVLREDGMLVITVRDYDEARRTKPATSAVQVSGSGAQTTITFQLWHWHADGERYDLEHFQLKPSDSGGWSTRVRRTTYWALTREQLAGLAAYAGFRGVTWHDPESTGYYQPILTARR